MQCEAKIQICVVPMGGGKTFVILTLVFIFSYLLKGVKICIFTSNAMLKKQLEDVLIDYCHGKNYEISDKMTIDEDTP